MVIGRPARTCRISLTLPSLVVARSKVASIICASILTWFPRRDSMSRNRNLFAWSLALVSGLAFAAGAGYPQAAQFLRQGLVATALAQDPVPTTPPQQQQQ